MNLELLILWKIQMNLNINLKNKFMQKNFLQNKNYIKFYKKKKKNYLKFRFYFVNIKVMENLLKSNNILMKLIYYKDYSKLMIIQIYLLF